MHKHHTHTHTHTNPQTHNFAVRVCLINGRGRDESLHVYRFGKHARCACCKILLIYDYLLHIPWICELRAFLAQLPAKHSGNKAKRYDVLDERRKKCCFRNRKPEHNYMFNVSAIHIVWCWAVAGAATTTAAVAARAHRYLCQNFMSHFWLHEHRFSELRSNTTAWVRWPFLNYRFLSHSLSLALRRGSIFFCISFV